MTLKSSNVFFLAIVASLVNAHSQTPFSLDSAASYLRVLSVEIGPRPMGSPNEQKAMDFALKKFKEFGLHETFLLPMATVKGDALTGTTNTRSGIAVGILRGATGRIIVIGGHIDSAGPDIPGANDDGSGSAVVLELARVLSKRNNESTIVFCLFGGEEQGLKGSKYFVQHFPQIDSVILMLQVDMANGSEWLVPLIDEGSRNSPRWLVRASFEEFQKLGYERLSYPTDFLALNSVTPGGGIGSDHMPFLEKNIPAIDFTSDINDPIHTPQDKFEFFQISGLKRSGDLVYRLVERFDGGVPEEKPENYFFAHVGSWLFFVPLWFVRLFIILAIIFGGFTVFRLRRHRTEIDKTSRPKIPGLKIFLLMIIVQVCVWSSELLVGLVKGVRYPWYSDAEGYFILGGLGGIIGVWIALRVAQKLTLSLDAYRYLFRSVAGFSLLLLVLGLLSAKATLYPAAALLLMSLASVIKNAWLKTTLWLFSAFVMYRLFFNEGFMLFARVPPEATMTAGIGFSLFWHTFLVVLFSLWFFPSMLGFASLYLESGRDLLWLRSFKEKIGLIMTSLAFLVCVAWLGMKHSYNEMWKQTIRVDQHFNYNSQKGSVFIRSSDYLNGARFQSDGGNDTLISGWTREYKVKDLSADQEPWITATRTIESTQTDSNIAMNILASIQLKHRPLSMTLTYTGGKNGLQEAGSAYAFTSTARTISLHWSFFPDSVLLVPVNFTIVGADSVTESVEAVFVQPLEDIEVRKDMAHVSTRTTLHQSATIRISN